MIPPPPTISTTARYAVAVLFVCLAQAVRLALLTFLGDSFAFIQYYPAIALAAWLGGFGPGVLATALSALGVAWFQFQPLRSFGVDEPSQLFALALFAVNGVIITVLSESVRRGRARADRAREELHTTLTSIGDGVIATDDTGRVTFLNPVAETLTGWPTNDARGRPIEEVFTIVHEGTREPAANPVTRVLREGITVGLANHTALISRDGTERPIDDSGAPIRLPDGRIVGAVLVFRDDTARRNAEKALRDQHRRYQSIVTQSSDGIWLADADTTILEVNAQACRLLGYDADALVGRPTGDLVDDGSRMDVPDAAERLARGEVVTWERWMIARGGGRRLMRGVSQAVEARLVVSTFRDVTDERRAAEERERLLEEAQAANRFKDEFIAKLSHELRTPLHNMLAWLQMLERNEVPADRVAHALSVIHRNAKAQHRLVDDLLDLSSMWTGRLQLNVQLTDLNEIVRNTIEVAGPGAGARQIALEARLAEGDLHVSGDAARLQQAIWNLVSNALKYTPVGGTITVTTEKHGQRYGIEVRDTGAGIPREFLAHVFEPFRQGGNVQRAPGSVGLGLAIVRDIVEAHGGTVGVSSDGPGHGAAFTIQLPAGTEASAGA